MCWVNRTSTHLNSSEMYTRKEKSMRKWTCVLNNFLDFKSCIRAVATNACRTHRLEWSPLVYPIVPHCSRSLVLSAHQREREGERELFAQRKLWCISVLLLFIRESNLAWFTQQTDCAARPHVQGCATGTRRVLAKRTEKEHTTKSCSRATTELNRKQKKNANWNNLPSMLPWQRKQPGVPPWRGHSGNWINQHEWTIIPTFKHTETPS